MILKPKYYPPKKRIAKVHGNALFKWCPKGFAKLRHPAPLVLCILLSKRQAIHRKTLSENIIFPRTLFHAMAQVYVTIRIP